jgi:tRNA1Val (adenine37-N6)-methyltransferase
MSNSYFQFKQFIIHQDRCAMKVTTDACLFGAWVAERGSHYLGRTHQVLDIGTGTGVLSLMYAQKNPSAAIEAIEMDAEACAQARENIAASPYPDQVTVFHADAKEFSFTHKYDVIFSNAPFYQNEIEPADERRNVALHGSGLVFDELASIVLENLSPHGQFYLLLPFKRNQEIKRLLLRRQLAAKNLVFVRQSTKHSFFRIILSGCVGSMRDETSLEEISICNEQQNYTNQFRELLKDFYLQV